MSAADVIADAIHANDCGCPDWHADDQEDISYREHATAVLAALSAAGYVVATPEEIRAWPVEQQAELIGGTVEKMMKPEWYDSGEPAPGNWPINAGRRMANGNRSDLRFVPSVRVVTPYEPEVRDDL